MKDTKWGHEYRLTTVCIDSYENRELKGRFFNPHLDEGKSFCSLVQFLKEMETMLDDMNFPQPFTRIRSFSSLPQQHMGIPPESMQQYGTLATFAVRVLFRQNSSWQGSITWLGEGKEECFRSVLELVLLMDSALNQSLQEKQTDDS